CQPDFRIARRRYSLELIGAEEFHLDTELVRLACNMAQGAYDAIDLRVPCVSNDQNFHAQAAFAAGGSATAGSVCVHVMISNLPSWPSTTAVQLSTQSPQFM